MAHSQIQSTSNLCNIRPGSGFSVLLKDILKSRGCQCNQSKFLSFLFLRDCSLTHWIETALSKETLVTFSQPQNHPWFSHRERIARNGRLMWLKDCAGQFVSILVTNCAVHPPQRRIAPPKQYGDTLSFSWLCFFSIEKFHGNELHLGWREGRWRSDACLHQHLMICK